MAKVTDRPFDVHTQQTKLQSRFHGPPTLSSLVTFLSMHTGRLPRAAPGLVPISSLPPEVLFVDEGELTAQQPAFPLLLPPAPLLQPPMGALYWLAWAWVLLLSLGPRVSESWSKRRRRRRRSAPAADEPAEPAEAAEAEGERGPEARPE